MASRLVRRAWRVLGSTWLAASLLAALLLASLLASLFPQMPADLVAREPWLSAVTLRYGWATRLMDILGLFDVYRAPWFLALLAALLLNTLACTIQRLPRLWRSLTKPPIITRPEAFYQGFAHRAEWPVPCPKEGLAAAQHVLARHRYYPWVEEDEQWGWASIYAERGRWAQVGTLISHVAALLLVIAVLARPALGWQETGVILLPGQVYTIEEWAVRAGHLTVDYYPSGSTDLVGTSQPRDYRVPLAVLLDGSLAVTETVRINHPLVFRGVTFHLQSYGPAAQLAAQEGTFNVAFTGGQIEEVALPEAGFTLRVAHQPGGDVLSGVEGGAFFVEALAVDGTVLGSGTVPDGQQIEIQGMPVRFRLINYTVWQVGRDPTFGLAVGIAILLLAGMAISLWIPQRRLWLRLDGQGGRMVGAGDFDEDFTVLADEIACACGPQMGISPPEGEADG